MRRKRGGGGTRGDTKGEDRRERIERSRLGEEAESLSVLLRLLDEPLNHLVVAPYPADECTNHLQWGFDKPFRHMSTKRDSPYPRT
jgi:hypothetical protein